MKHNCTLFLLTVLNSFLFIGACIAEQTRIMFALLMILIGLIMCYAIFNKERTIVLAGFLISFFTFLLGRTFIFFLISPFFKEIRILESLSQTSPYDAKIFIPLYISLLCVYWGHYWGLNRFSYPFKIYFNQDQFNRKIIAIRIFYITFPFKCFYVAKFAQNTLENSYANLNAVIHIPFYINWLYLINTIAFICFLVSMPTKRELKIPIVLFLIITALSLYMGERGPVVANILFLLIYFISRDYIEKPTKRFVSKRTIFLLIVISPFALIFLNLFADFRSSREIDSNGFLLDFFNFFLQQGGSSHLIAMVDDYQLPDTNTFYTLGPLTNYFSHWWHSSPYAGDMDVALYGNNLGATLTYLSNENYYLSGGGLGTQYIAELKVDFGYWGIVIYNVFLGIMLRYLSFDVKKSPYMQIFASLLIITILSLPRDFCLSWVVRLIAPLNILTALLIFSLSTLRKKHYYAK